MSRSGRSSADLDILGRVLLHLPSSHRTNPCGQTPTAMGTGALVGPHAGAAWPLQPGRFLARLDSPPQRPSIGCRPRSATGEQAAGTRRRTDAVPCHQGFAWSVSGGGRQRFATTSATHGLEPRNRCFKIDDAGCCPIGRTTTGSKTFPSPRRDGRCRSIREPCLPSERGHLGIP